MISSDIQIEALLSQQKFLDDVAKFRKAWKLPANGLDMAAKAADDQSIRSLKSFLAAKQLYDRNNLPVELLLDDPKDEDYYASYWHWSDKHGHLNQNLRPAIAEVAKNNSLGPKWHSFIKWYLFFNDPKTHAPLKSK